MNGFGIAVFLVFFFTGLSQDLVQAQPRARDFSRPYHLDQSFIPPLTPEDLRRMNQANIAARDISEAEEFVRSSYPALDQAAQEYLAKAGLKFQTPVIQYYGYRNLKAPSRCGESRLDNAIYCFLDNTINFDIIYLAKVIRFVKGKTKTDGKYAAMTMVAHELGHAVDYKWARLVAGVGSQAWGILYELTLERNADCFAGAALSKIVIDRTRKVAVPDREKEKSIALLEGRLALYAVQGDRSDRYYPPGEERMRIFQKGFEEGTGTCYELKLEKVK
ncbi:MAG: neutral zinc metallopeptidase [Deltaproteobacteria bacterium]|nr:neutral zinc metallopeptidase [Deltaproteobacteria bacterium]